MVWEFQWNNFQSCKIDVEANNSITGVEKVMCCNVWFHADCVAIDNDAYTCLSNLYVIEGNACWNCQECCDSLSGLRALCSPSPPASSDQSDNSDFSDLDSDPDTESICFGLTDVHVMSDRQTVTDVMIDID